MLLVAAKHSLCPAPADRLLHPRRAGEAQETALASPAKRSKKAGSKKAGSSKTKKAAAPAWVGKPSGQAKGRTMYAKARMAGCEVTPGCVVSLAADDDDEEEEGSEVVAPLGLVQCLYEVEGEKKVQVGGPAGRAVALLHVLVRCDEWRWQETVAGACWLLAFGPGACCVCCLGTHTYMC